MEQVFFLDEEDKALITRRRGPHMMLGFGLQVVAVRYLGCFLTDPLEVPVGVLEVVAEQLGIEDSSCVKRYLVREKTRLDHVWEIREAYGLKNFAEHEGELTGKVFARAWNTGDGPTGIFHYAVRWLRENDVLLPGLTTLTRLVARTRDEATGRLYETLAGLPTAVQGDVLDLLLEVPEGGRVSTLERWRTGPTKASGPGMVKALDLAAEVAGAGFATLDLHAVVPARRVVELGKYGMEARSAQLKKHPLARRRATLLATVQRLETKTVDDALELLDLLMVTELSGRARREADKQTVRRHPRLAKASARLALAVEVMFEAADWGAEDEVRLVEVWEAIEAVVPRADLRAAVATVTGMVAPPDAEDDGGWRAEMATKYQVVSGMVKMLTEVIEFGANAEGERVLAAMAGLPGVLALPVPQPLGHGAAPPADRPRGGQRAVEAPGVRASAAHRRSGGPQRVRVLRAGAVPPPSQAPRDLRHGLQPVARPQRPAAGGCGVGGGQGQRDD